jgi:NADH-quinone oxidoreductase subunit K
MLAAVLFAIGFFGVVPRRNTVGILLGIELMLNAVNINLVAFSHRFASLEGQIFTIFIITVAAGEAAVGLAMAFACRPSVIVLDEPTTDLDPEGRAEVFELIRKLRAQNLSLIVIEHESEELRLADRIIVLREGEIAAGRQASEWSPLSSSK